MVGGWFVVTIDVGVLCRVIRVVRVWYDIIQDGPKRGLRATL